MLVSQGETMLTLAVAHGRTKATNILCQIKANAHIENAKVVILSKPNACMNEWPSPSR